MSAIYLVHITAFDTGLGQEVIYRYCSGRGFVTGSDAAKRPSGVPANIAYEPRVKQPANLRRDCFSGGATGGRTTVGYGELILSNSDGALDFLLDKGLDGRLIEIVYGNVTIGQNPTFTSLLVGTMEMPRFTSGEVALRLRDRLAELDKPLQPTKYAGNNSLPNGLEGVAGDLSGKVKPKLFGKVYNIAPPCVNTSRLIYQVNDGAVAAINSVYDRGVSLSNGAAYTSQADMEANAPTAGTYRVWLAGGYFRLGSSPAGTVTTDAIEGTNASDRTAAQVAKRIALASGLNAGYITAGDITALDTANSAELGVWFPDDIQVTAALDQVAGSVGAWYGFDRLGQFRISRIAAPSGTPVVNITAADMISLQRLTTNDTNLITPPYRCTAKYKKHYTVQSTDLAGAVTADRRGELSNEYRTVVSSDASVLSFHKLSKEISITTAFINASDATTEASRVLDMHKVRRDRLEVKLAADIALLQSLELGNVIQITHPRYGYNNGTKFVITGIQADYRAGVLLLSLWG